MTGGKTDGTESIKLQELKLKGEFLKLYYTEIRKEIRASSSRIFKLAGYGIVVVPAAHAFANAIEQPLIKMIIPILVIVVALLFLAENRALMRAGWYLRDEIEPKIKDVKGWENWLKEEKHRKVDKRISRCFYILFLVYYAGSVFIAAQIDFENVKYADAVMKDIIIIFYILLGIGFFGFMYKENEALYKKNKGKTKEVNRMKKEKRKEFIEEWKNIRKNHPEFARSFVAQSFIIMEASESGNQLTQARMCGLLNSGAFVLFEDYWGEECEPIKKQVVIGGVIGCVLESPNIDNCFELEKEDDWFDDPFKEGFVIPTKPPVPPY